ncbi:hypothetical protein V8G54_013582 [Vigna mungo]|uniref:Uncharacterized protein n=1 Tax=Vigna mungo TaxID=3915 RepID=A0AAQ3NT67_VIGMU
MLILISLLLDKTHFHFPFRKHTTHVKHGMIHCWNGAFGFYVFNSLFSNVASSRKLTRRGDDFFWIYSLHHLGVPLLLDRIRADPFGNGESITVTAGGVTEIR